MRIRSLMPLLACGVLAAQAPQQDAPVISFPKPHHDFGKVPQDRKVSHRFKVTNTGKSVLNITHLNPSCGCTATVLEKWSLAPGEETFVEANFNPSGMRGQVRKSIQVISNDPVNRTYNLTFEAEVVSEIMPSTNALFFVEVPRTAIRRSEVRLVSGNNQPVNITQVKAPGAPHLTFTWRSENKDAVLTVQFDPSKVPARLRQGTDVITVGHTNPRMSPITINASWDIKPVIAHEPQRVSFLDVAGQALRARLKLRHVEGKAFTVRSAECKNPLFTVEGVGKRASQHELTVLLSPSAKKGVLNERLLVLTDDPEQPEMEVVVSAILQ